MEKKWIAYLEELLSTSGLDTATHNFHASRIHSLSTSSILATSFTGGVVASHVASTRAASRSSGSSSGSSGGGGGGGGGGSW